MTSELEELMAEIKGKCISDILVAAGTCIQWFKVSGLLSLCLLTFAQHNNNYKSFPYNRSAK